MVCEKSTLGFKRQNNEVVLEKVPLKHWLFYFSLSHENVIHEGVGVFFHL